MIRLFLSCASTEFAEIREQMARDLRRPNVEVKAHEEVRDFNSGETTLEKLDEYIRGCNAVVHLVGTAPGSEVEAAQVAAVLRRYPDLLERMRQVAPLAAKDAPWRGSYTQWEAYLAIYHILQGHEARCFIYRAAEGIVDRSEPTGLARQRQEEHFRRLEALGRDRNDFASREDLRVQVLNNLLEFLSRQSDPLQAQPSNLWKLQTKPDAVFVGREKELANLDALWADALAEKRERARIVSLVAIGGAGKTTLVSRWKEALLSREDHGGVERYFDWSFYSQGVRGTVEGATSQVETDSTAFIAEALKFFGNPELAEAKGDPWDKGCELARLAAKHRTLLVLDGVEPLQHPPGPQTGELKDQVLQALLAGMKNAGAGLCVITTRESIADLAATRETITPEWRLDRLSDEAGAMVLRRHGVIGPEAELRAASWEVRGHALTLTLMGRYLTLAFDPPDITRRDCFRFREADAETRNGHAFSVFAAYERWFEKAGRHVELAILRLLGLFDRPAPPDCLAVLREPPSIPGLTEALQGLDEKRWNSGVKRLFELGLVETRIWTPTPVRGYIQEEARRCMNAAWEQLQDLEMSPPELLSPTLRVGSGSVSLDAHPLLREYFAMAIGCDEGVLAAHARLFDALSASVPYWPEGKEGLQPLYEAIPHGCKGGRAEEAKVVYRDRVLRGTFGRQSHYSASLGLLGMDLAAVRAFFVAPWTDLLPEFPPSDAAWLLTEASFALRQLGRTTEAAGALSKAAEVFARLGERASAAATNQNLGEVCLALGRVREGVAACLEGVRHADAGAGALGQISALAALANALHQSGNRVASATYFLKAEALQARVPPMFPYLYSYSGYLYCEFLLSHWERACWGYWSGTVPANKAALIHRLGPIESRVGDIVGWTESMEGLTPALSYICFGRVRFAIRLLQENARLDQQAFVKLDEAIRVIRSMGLNELLPNALLPRAWWHATEGEWDASRERLDEAFSIATRSGRAERQWEGGMRLHLIDTLLHRARLFGRLKDEGARPSWIPVPPAEYPWPGRTARGDLKEAAALIEVCGYHRRDEELTDALRGLA